MRKLNRTNNKVATALRDHFTEDPATERTVRQVNTAVVAILGLESIRIASMGLFGDAVFATMSMTVFYALLGVGVLLRKWSLPLTSLLFVMLAGAYAALFPDVSNHSWFTLYMLGFALVSDPTTGSGRARYTMLTRVLLASLFFYSGLHKAMLPEWRTGTIFLDMPHIADGASVQSALALARLAGISECLAMALLANVAWFAECALGLAFIYSRSRPFAVWGSIALMIAIQLSAGEYYFAALVGAALVASQRSRPLHVLYFTVVLSLALYTVIDVVGRLS